MPSITLADDAPDSIALITASTFGTIPPSNEIFFKSEIVISLINEERSGHAL